MEGRDRPLGIVVVARLQPENSPSHTTSLCALIGKTKLLLFADARENDQALRQAYRSSESSFQWFYCGASRWMQSEILPIPSMNTVNLLFAQ
jgi:hypothetical protein